MKKFLFLLLVAASFVFGNSQATAQDLEGIIKLSDLQSEPYSKWYFDNFHAAHPDDAVLSKIKGLLQDKKIVIVMGTWCGDSKMWVPYFYRMLELMDYDPGKVTLIAINRDKKAEGVNLEKYKIERIPTFIIYDKNGKELGRIVESPRYSLEKDLLEILEK